MFELRNVPMYIQSLGHKKTKIGKDEYKGTEFVLKVDPFTPELAAQLAETKGIVFRRNDAEVNPHIDLVSFTYVPPAQRLEIRPDPAIVKPSVVLLDCKVTKFKARKPKDGTQWVLTCRVICTELSGDDLLYLKEALFEQRYFSFDDMQGGLYNEAEAEERRDSPEAKPVRRGRGGDSAVAH